MKAFLTKNYRLMLASVLSLCAGLGVGLAIRGTQNPVPAAEPIIGEDTVMERVIVFDSCTHEARLLMDRNAYLGYTKEELKRQFPDASISEFSNARVTLVQSQDAYCPNHYLLRLQDDGTLAVMHTDSQFFTEEVVAVLRDEHDALSRLEPSLLTDGLAFSSLSEIDTYLESIGS